MLTYDEFMLRTQYFDEILPDFFINGFDFSKKYWSWANEVAENYRRKVEEGLIDPDSCGEVMICTTPEQIFKEYFADILVEYYSDLLPEIDIEDPACVVPTRGCESGARSSYTRSWRFYLLGRSFYFTKHFRLISILNKYVIVKVACKKILNKYVIIILDKVKHICYIDCVNHISKERIIMAIGERIRFFRNLRGMTQKYLGTLVGFPEKTADIRMAQYESGTRTPKADLTNELAGALGVSPAALNVPDIESYNGVMHTLFTLEDLYGLQIDTLSDEVCIRLNKYNGTAYITMFEMFSAWQKMAEKYRKGEISKEEYDQWRYNYPKC